MAVIKDIALWDAYFSFKNQYKSELIMDQKAVRVILETTVPIPELTSEVCEQINKAIGAQVQWVKANQELLKNEIIYEGFFELAEEWLENDGHLTEGEYSLSEEDFKVALCLLSMRIKLEKVNQVQQVSLMFRCEPDYFSSHALTIYLDGQHFITSIGFDG